MIEILLLSILTTLIVTITTLAFGFWSNKIPEGVSVWQHSRFIFFYFVQMISYSMIAFLLSMFIKRAGLAMGVFFIYMILENVLVGILQNKYRINMVQYLPEEVTDKLIPMPYMKAIITTQGAERWEQLIPVFLAIALAWLLLYCLVTCRHFLKSDL
jgi:hypothetical protein